jgi:hypothetical protein
MSTENYFDTDVGSQTVDVSAATRKFQTSIIVKQDEGKSGILSFLQKVEEATPQVPTRTAPQTMRPSTQGNY